ncbi:MAG TPA: hypothetical protein VK436_10965 [Methanocella sp.]|nr:hypothetical protein [Methanocella sp.]
MMMLKPRFSKNIPITKIANCRQSDSIPTATSSMRNRNKKVTCATGV